MARKFDHSNLRQFRTAIKVAYKDDSYSIGGTCEYDPKDLLVWDRVLDGLEDYALAEVEPIGIWHPWQMALHFKKQIEGSDEVEEVVYFVTRRNLFSSDHQRN